MTATIIVNKPGEPLRTVVLTDLTSIGRAIDNTVAIDSATMSRYHTVIEKRGEDYWLKDLSSGNGTRLNGELVYEPSKLENGDTFILGEYGPIEFRQQNSVDHTDYPRVPGVNDSAVFSSPWSSEVLNPRPTPSQEYLAQFETISDELPELQASVVVSSPGISAHQIDLSEHTRIGRAEDNLICIDDAAVSRYHATIERKTDGFWLKDLGSSNGTTVNGNDAIKATKLNNGDLILIGGVGRIEFRSNEWSRQEAKIDSRLNGKSAGNHLSPYATIGSAIDPSDVMSISKAGVEQVAIINLKVAGHQGQEIEIAGTTNIGRAFDNKICIDDPSLSRYHAKIEQEKDGFWITDFSSGNGTMRNGNPITERTLLSEGDVLSVGSAKLHFGYTPKPVGGMKEPAPRRAQPAPPPMPAPPPDDSTKVISMPQLGAAAGAESLFPSVSGLTPPGVPNLSAPSIPGSPAPAVPTVPSVSAPQIPSMPQPPTPPALPQSQLEEMGKTIIRVSIAIGASVAALVIGLLIILALMFFFGGRESGKC